VAAAPAGDASSTYPQIATDGKVFAIAWQDRRHGAWDLFFRLVKPDGSSASNELTVRQDQESISVAAQLVWTGAEYGVVFADTRKEYAHFQIYLARIAADGSKVVSEHAITSAKDNADTPGVAFWNGSYWISWIEKPWCGDAEPFAVMAGSPVIDNGADLGMAFTGAGADIGAVEFGLPWGSSTSIATAVHLALFDPVTGKISSAVTVADNKGFSAFPVLQVLKEKMRAVWFDDPGQQRDLFAATVACEVAP